MKCWCLSDRRVRTAARKPPTPSPRRSPLYRCAWSATTKRTGGSALSWTSSSTSTRAPTRSSTPASTSSCRVCSVNEASPWPPPPPPPHPPSSGIHSPHLFVVCLLFSLTEPLCIRFVGADRLRIAPRSSTRRPAALHIPAWKLPPTQPKRVPAPEEWTEPITDCLLGRENSSAGTIRTWTNGSWRTNWETTSTKSAA